MTEFVQRVEALPSITHLELKNTNNSGELNTGALAVDIRDNIIIIDQIYEDITEHSNNTRSINECTLLLSASIKVVILLRSYRYRLLQLLST